MGQKTARLLSCLFGTLMVCTLDLSCGSAGGPVLFLEKRSGVHLESSLTCRLSLKGALVLESPSSGVFAWSIRAC